MVLDGVGCVVGPEGITSMKDCMPYSSWRFETTFQKHGPDINFITHCVLHSGRWSWEKHNHLEIVEKIPHDRSRHAPAYILLADIARPFRSY